MFKGGVFLLTVFFSALCFGAGGQAFEVFQSPALAGKSILFTARAQYAYDHHNTETTYQKGEISAVHWQKCAGDSSLVRIDFDAAGACKNIEVLLTSKDGIIRNVSPSFDGKKALFSMRNNFDDSFKIYEIDLDTKAFKRLTNLTDASDIDPAYLPDGGIIFTSTRASKYCGCNRHIMGNLYRMDADGANILQVGNSIEYENTPHVMADGRILYTRWEYVDRNFSGAQGLWICNPDGTRHALYWGQETKNPALNGADMPSGKIAAIIGACHDLPRGALAVIDRNIDVEGARSVTEIFPSEARALIDKAGDRNADSMKALKIKYEDPEPLSDDVILVTRSVSESDAQDALFAVDLKTRKETLIARATNPRTGVFDVKLLQARKAPPAIPTSRAYEGDSGLVYVSDVYESTHMKGVKRGDVKYLRIVENPAKQTWGMGIWSAEGYQAPAMNYDDYDRKIVLGTVPVEEDGSAYFKAPSDKFIYFQALDKDKKMIQTMRSGLVLLPAEISSCTGCHESRQAPPPLSARPSAALRRKPSKINPSPLPQTYLNYAKDIQPIFDKYCLECHDFGKAGAKKVILAGDRGIVFNKSYTELHSKKFICEIGAGPDRVQEADTWGARQSKITKLIESGHKGLKMSREDFEKLISWMDVNAPYYASEDDPRIDNPAGRSPLNFEELKELQALTGKKILSENGKIIFARIYPLEIVSFDRPELSQILDGTDKNSAAYARALALIKTGQSRLKEAPRADMQGFEESESAKARYARAHKMLRLEKLAREAAAANKKFYDPESLDDL